MVQKRIHTKNKITAMKKNILMTVFLIGLSASSYAQSKSVESLYQKYKTSPDFFHLDLSGSFMNLAKGLNIQMTDEGAHMLSNSVDRIKMFKLPAANAGNEIKMLVKALQKENFELLMEAGQRTNGVQLFSKGSKQINDVVVLVSNDSGECMVFELMGDFNSKSLASLGKSFQ